MSSREAAIGRLYEALGDSTLSAEKATEIGARIRWLEAQPE